MPAFLEVDLEHVSCRIGSLEAEDPGFKVLEDVSCRIGSLEVCAKVVLIKIIVSCRIGRKSPSKMGLFFTSHIDDIYVQELHTMFPSCI